MPRPLSVLVLSAVLLFTAPGLTAAVPAAAGDGVQVDPDSAPAKEYALPLDSARGVGADSGSAGGGASREGGQGPPAAFGSGITPKALDAQGRSRSGEATRPDGRTRSGDRAVARGDEKSGRADRSASSIDDADDDDGSSSANASASASASPLAYSLGGVLVVLAAGGLVALALRRRQSPA